MQRVLQRVAACCSVWQCVASRCVVYIYTSNSSLHSSATIGGEFAGVKLRGLIEFDVRWLIQLDDLLRWCMTH